MPEDPKQAPPQGPPEPAAPPLDPSIFGSDGAPNWEYRTTGFKVVGRMKEIVNLTIEVTQAEIKQLRKKIEKLTYGA